MTVPRVFDPAEGTLLYHYCSPETFLAICSGKKLRFCDLGSMNDYMERHWGYQVWTEAASALIDTVGVEFLDKIDEVVSGSGMVALPLAACLSSDGDTLSQWRAYAQDGVGFAVGFDAKALLNLPVKPLVVCYDRQVQVEEVTRFVQALHALAQDEPADQEMFFHLAFMLAMDLTAYKNPAFAEEAETRLLHVLNFQPSGGSLKLVDSGGTAFGAECAPQPVKFFMKSGCPVAHLDIDLFGSDAISPIREVIIGPRNDSLLSGISVLMETLGHSGVSITKSKASYR